MPTPPRSSLRAATAALILSGIIWIAQPSLRASAQSERTGTVTFSNGSQVHATILLYLEGQKLVLEHEGQTLVYAAAQVRSVAFDATPPSSPLAAVGAAALTPPVSSQLTPPSAGLEQADYFRAQELVRLSVQREHLLASNRRWKPVAVVLGLGVASILIGAGLLVASWNDSYDCFDCSYNETKWRAAVALMPIGGAIVLSGVPMLIVRASRSARLRRIEQTITRLGGQLSLAPLWTPQGHAGASARG